MKKPIPVLIFIMSLFLVWACVKDNKLDYQSDPSRTNHEKDTLAFTDEEIALIMAGDSADLMRVLTIHTIVYDTAGADWDTITNQEDSIRLRTPSRDVRVDSTDTILTRLINRMLTTVHDPAHPGIGIAAPQVGINRNIIWVQRLDKVGNPFEVYLNVKIVAYSSKLIIFNGDGCLSIPGMSGKTDRYSSVCVEYDLPDGTHNCEVVEGYSSIGNCTAVIFQHEIDHLLGILFIDRLHVYTKMDRDMFEVIESAVNTMNAR
ncbi:MAG: peptide deformylase [Bacteroidota bacterium]